MRNHDAQSLYALGANKKCYVAAKKMQDSVNVKARLKKRGTYIWNLGWLVKDVQIVVLLRKLHTREGMLMGQSRIPKGQK